MQELYFYQLNISLSIRTQFLEEARREEMHTRKWGVQGGGQIPLQYFPT
jgi:hypothetical protein